MQRGPENSRFQMPIRADELQRYGYAFLRRDLTRQKFERLC